MVGGQAGGVGAVAVVAQDEDGLVVAGQRPCVGAGAQSAAVGAQEAGQVADQFLGDVECGTTGDQRSLSGVRGFSSQIPLLPGGSVLLPGNRTNMPLCRICALASASAIHSCWDRPSTPLEEVIHIHNRYILLYFPDILRASNNLPNSK